MDMKRKHGPSIQSKHVKALHRIAYMLYTEALATDVKALDLSIKTFEARRIDRTDPLLDLL